MGLFGFGKKKDKLEAPPAPSTDSIPPAPNATNSTKSSSSDHIPDLDSPMNQGSSADDLQLPELPSMEEQQLPDFNMNEPEDFSQFNPFEEQGEKNFFDDEAQNDEQLSDDLPQADKTEEVPKTPTKVQKKETSPVPAPTAPVVENDQRKVINNINFDSKTGDKFFTVDDFQKVGDHILSAIDYTHTLEGLQRIEHTIKSKTDTLYAKAHADIVHVQKELSEITTLLFEE